MGTGLISHSTPYVSQGPQDVTGNCRSIPSLSSTGGHGGAPHGATGRPPGAGGAHRKARGDQCGRETGGPGPSRAGRRGRRRAAREGSPTGPRLLHSRPGRPGLTSSPTGGRRRRRPRGTPPRGAAAPSRGRRGGNTPRPTRAGRSRTAVGGSGQTPSVAFARQRRG